MDPDEILARKLQAEEDAAAASLAALNFRSSPAEQVSFISQVQGAIEKVKLYEDELAQAMALSVMDDLEAMKIRSQEAAALSLLLQETPPLAEEDQLALELLSWFKLDFFTWVDNPPCSYCRNPNTQATQTAAPSAEEQQHLASRTEVYYCKLCGSKTRFPRYNDPVKLLEPNFRRGRCGEWANAFCLICRAAGLDARLVLDFTDHIWVEYYSHAMKRWVHMDPCEATADKPLLYEVGWGKKLTYLIAVGRTGVLDVSRRYTRQYNDVMRSRRGLDDDWISSYLKNLTKKMRSENPEIDEDERIRLEVRDDADVAEMMAASEKKLSKVELESLPGRQTGGADWINSRGEGGGGDNSAPTVTTSSPQQQQSTRYQWARDTANNNTQISTQTTLETREKSITLKRICGGVVRASGENPPNETVIKAFDGKLNTKWLDFGGAKDNTAWLEYRLLPTDELTVLKKYALSSGDDSPERDPEHILLEAWVEEEDNGEGTDGNSSKNIGGRWVVLDERPGLKFLSRGQRCEFEVGKVVPTRRWRLRIVRVLHPDRANSVQLACWDLYKE